MEESTEITVEAKQPAKKRRLWLRILCIALAALILLVGFLGLVFYSVWNDEIATVSSFKKLRDRNDANEEGSVYRMDVKGGFYFDKLLKQGGVKNDSELKIGRAHV